MINVHNQIQKTIKITWVPFPEPGGPKRMPLIPVLAAGAAAALFSASTRVSVLSGRMGDILEKNVFTELAY